MATSAYFFTIFAITSLIITATSARPDSFDPENDIIYEICRQTHDTKLCLYIMKTNLTRYEHMHAYEADRKEVAVAVIDLAIAKSEQIHDNLNRYYDESKNEALKEKYITCSKNYNDVSRNLRVVRDEVVSGNLLRNVQVEIDDAVQELKNCKGEFDEKAFDPAHIRNRNREFGVYLDMLGSAVDYLIIRQTN